MGIVCLGLFHINFIAWKKSIYKYDKSFKKQCKPTRNGIGVSGWVTAVLMVMLIRYSAMESGELQTTICHFGVPVYVGLLNTGGMYCWHFFKPHTITVPELQSSVPVYPFTAKHIEIVQSNRNHYDSVVAMFPGAQALQPPRINTCVLKTIQID